MVPVLQEERVCDALVDHRPSTGLPQHRRQLQYVRWKAEGGEVGGGWGGAGRGVHVCVWQVGCLQAGGPVGWWSGGTTFPSRGY